MVVMVFFFNDTATTEIYTLSLHDALPISAPARAGALPASGHLARDSAHGAAPPRGERRDRPPPGQRHLRGDRKSTRLNSSHANISYAVFCLKKKKKMCQTISTMCIHINCH